MPLNQTTYFNQTGLKNTPKPPKMAPQIHPKTPKTVSKTPKTAPQTPKMASKRPENSLMTPETHKSLLANVGQSARRFLLGGALPADPKTGDIDFSVRLGCFLKCFFEVFEVF
jgi:hypothetical protein